MTYQARARKLAEIEQHWEGDKLDRAKLALDIERYILDRSFRPASEEGALTIAIDGDYGAGKSFFLRRLRRQLSDQFPVAFVDAWADDSGDDPLLALMLAIHEALARKIGLGPSADETRRKVLAKARALGAVAAKSILRGGLKFLITEKGVSEFEDVLQAGLDESFEAYAQPASASSQSLLLSRRSQIEQFQSSLTELLSEIQHSAGVSLPLIVLVDELDRCRPTYALKLLEESKHFFDNTQTVFVFGTNVAQLTHTVRAVYGAEYNASHYLSRFLKVSLNLPVPDAMAFVETLMESDTVAIKDWRIVSANIPNTKSDISRWLADLFRQGGLTARDIERVMDNMLVATRIRDDRYSVQLAILAPLAMLDYLRRTGRSTQVGSSYTIPQINRTAESEKLYDDLMRRHTAAAILEKMRSQHSHHYWIREYAQEYFNSVRTDGPNDLNNIKLPHHDYSELLKRVGPRSYGDEDSVDQ